MRSLYFDIDGTLLDQRNTPKPLLADGGFERGVRAAGFERLVCVGNVILIVRALEGAGDSCDGLQMAWRSCQGVFRDESWFRTVTELVEDPDDRVAHVDQQLDWWYVDDLAEHYCQRAGAAELFTAHLHRRIFVPDPAGSGDGVLQWLASIR